MNKMNVAKKVLAALSVSLVLMGTSGVSVLAENKVYQVVDLRKDPQHEEEKNIKEHLLRVDYYTIDEQFIKTEYYKTRATADVTLSQLKNSLNNVGIYFPSNLTFELIDAPELQENKIMTNYGEISGPGMAVKAIIANPEVLDEEPAIWEEVIQARELHYELGAFYRTTFNEVTFRDRITNEVIDTRYYFTDFGTEDERKLMKEEFETVHPQYQVSSEDFVVMSHADKHLIESNIENVEAEHIFIEALVTMKGTNNTSENGNSISESESIQNKSAAVESKANQEETKVPVASVKTEEDTKETEAILQKTEKRVAQEKNEQKKNILPKTGEVASWMSMIMVVFSLGIGCLLLVTRKKS